MKGKITNYKQQISVDPSHNIITTNVKLLATTTVWMIESVINKWLRRGYSKYN